MTLRGGGRREAGTGQEGTINRARPNDRIHRNADGRLGAVQVCDAAVAVRYDRTPTFGFGSHSGLTQKEVKPHESFSRIPVDTGRDLLDVGERTGCLGIGNAQSTVKLFQGSSRNLAKQ